MELVRVGMPNTWDCSVWINDGRYLVRCPRKASYRQRGRSGDPFVCSSHAMDAQLDNLITDGLFWYEKEKVS